MQPTNEPQLQSPSPRRQASRLGVMVGVGILVVLLGAATIWMSAGLSLQQWMTMFEGGRTHFNVDQPTVVRQIQQLQRLETVSYTMDKIISGEHGNPYLPGFLAGDRLLLVMQGEVIAGVNLAKLQPTDVIVSGRNISIHLPTAEIFVTRLDNGKTRVYSRDTGVFTSPDINLESEVRQEAERQLQQAALQDGILKKANQSAANTISSMLRGFGFTQVNLR